MNTIINNKVHRYSLVLEMDEELRDWYENRLDKGAYLQHLIAEDRDRHLYQDNSSNGK